MSKDKRLGRGLAALLGETSPVEATPEEATPAPAPPTEPSGSPQDVIAFPNAGDAAPAPATPATPPAAGEAIPNIVEEEPRGELLHLSVYAIDDNPFQPRRDFSEPEIASLAESLKSHDMLQPVLVRRHGDRYQLISGERRLRAAIQAGWQTIPAQLRDADDRLVAELAIVENLQRKDLNPVEKALSFRRYIDEHDCTQDDLAKRLKIDRSTIANLMRLLELPEEILRRLREGSLSAGHARALLPLGEEHLQLEFARKIRSEGWSVRATERNVQTRIQEEDGDSPATSGGGGAKRTKNSHVASMEQELKTALGAKVEIRQSGKRRGQIVIHFASHEEFDRLRAHLTDSQRPDTAAG